MKYRTYANTDLKVSTVGFGLWTLSTGWWGQYTEGEAIALMHKALDLGVTLFDAADTYGNGLSEEFIAKAFPTRRDDIVIATKIGYDVLNFGNTERRGQSAIPHNFSPDALVLATDAALVRLKTDRIDLMQLHNIGLAEVNDDAIWETMETLKRQGKIRYYGMALGPAIGWLYEGVRCVQRRNCTSVQHIYNLLEQHPGAAIQQAAREAGKDTMFMVRVPHSSGMLEGKYTVDTVFEANDHRRHRPRSWLISGVQKVNSLRFLEKADRSLGQAALQWLLTDELVASTLPNIYNEEQLKEFAAAPDCPDLTPEDLARLLELHRENFGAPADECKFKGTMTLEALAEAEAGEPVTA